MDTKEIAVTAGSGCVWCDIGSRHQTPCGVIERLRAENEALKADRITGSLSHIREQIEQIVAGQLAHLGREATISDFGNTSCNSICLQVKSLFDALSGKASECRDEFGDQYHYVATRIRTEPSDFWDADDKCRTQIFLDQNQQIAVLTRERDEAREEQDDPGYCPICQSCGIVDCCGEKRCKYVDDHHAGISENNKFLSEMHDEQEVTIAALATRAEAAERERDEFKQLADTIERAYRREERQVAAMRGTLEHIGNSELMGMQGTKRIALAAIQPAPDPKP